MAQGAPHTPQHHRSGASATRMANRARRLFSALLLGSFLQSAPILADPLEEGFRAPPQEAKPRVWWHWMDGNVSTKGIDSDLAWMQDAGIGGVQNFDGAIDTPKIVDHQVTFMSPEWRETLRHAVENAAAKGMEFTIASAPGWSQTGGPWVRPEQAMKKLAWSELEVAGGKRVQLRLPAPPTTSGPFQNIPGGGAEPSNPEVPTGLPQLYRDAIVMAYRIPEAEQDVAARVTASSPVEAARLTDGDLATPVMLPVSGERDGWIQFDYGRPQTIRSATLVLGSGQKVGPIPPSWPIGSIEASDDGRSFRKVAMLPPRGAPEQTLSFPAVTARYFRLRLENRYGPGPLAAFDFPQPAPTAHRIMELRLSSAARVHRFEDKAGWSTIAGLGEQTSPQVDAGAVIAPGDVLDITPFMANDGTLDWKAPAGRWRVLRLGWSLTGKLNNPASAAGTGLEVDKLNGKHVAAYLDSYLGVYRDAVGKDLMGRNGIGYMLNDSFEALASNWTDDILEQFASRRGYDPKPWLPVLLGRVVKSAAESDRFLWDYRRTLADLITQEHYQRISRTLHANGMKHYAESHEGLRAFVGDGMEAKRDADVPMGAQWVGMGEVGPFLPDIRESASVAHIYGQNLVAAESFTAMRDHYYWPPSRLKATADLMLANGLNRFVIHTSVHQPDDRPGPGIGLGPFGQWFTRKETWAGMASAWTAYLARSSYMLQQGRNLADIAWFYGEDDNITEVFQTRSPEVPEGYAMDFVNADALRNAVEVQDGRIVAKGGARYRILALDPVSRRMTLSTLRRLRALVEAGAIVAGARPEQSISLSDDSGAFDAEAKALWTKWSGTRLFPDVAAAAAALNLPPDVDLGKTKGLQFVHRQLDAADTYFIANLTDEPVSTDALFRIGGGTPEIWRADTGETMAAPFRREQGRTKVPLTLPAHDAFFVVFRHPAPAQGSESTPAYRADPGPLRDRIVASPKAGWTLTFNGPCAPSESLRRRDLASLSESHDPKVRYFSGTTRYDTSFRLDAGGSEAGRLFVDLGDVRDIARVTVNGKPVGIAWKAPFRLDITDAAKGGANKLVVEVANSWPNRLIGDKAAPGEASCAFAAYDPYKADSPLLQSGLLGPVNIIEETREALPDRSAVTPENF